MRLILIVVLALALAYTLDRLARIENQRYAMMIGMCTVDMANTKPFWDCLASAQTRTTWFWHVYYGLTSRTPPVTFWSSRE